MLYKYILILFRCRYKNTNKKTIFVKFVNTIMKQKSTNTKHCTRDARSESNRAYSWQHIHTAFIPRPRYKFINTETEIE